MSLGLLQNSLVVAGVTTLHSVVLGAISTLFAVGLPPALRKAVFAIAVVVFVMPPFLVSNTWLNYFGLNGTWRPFLDFDIYSLKGTVLLLTLQLWPIPFLLFSASCLRIDRVYLEQEPRLRGFGLLRYLVWPAIRSVLGFAALLTFVLAFNNFTIPALLQTKVFAAEVWLSFNTRFDYSEALRLSWPLIAAPLTLFLAFRPDPIRFVARTEASSAGLWRARLSFLFPASAILGATFIFVSLGLPLGQLAGSARTWAEFLPAIEAGTHAAMNSLLFAAGSALLVTALGVISARLELGAITWILFLIPGVLLGIAFIRLFNRPGLAAFYQSVGIVFLAFTARYAALGWSGARAAFALADRSLSDVVSVFGGSRWQQFRFAEWFQTKWLLLTSFYLVYLLCLWEVETLILIVPPGRETLGLRIFNMLHYGHAAQVDALCVWMLIFGLAPLLVFLPFSRMRGAFLFAPLFLLGCGSEPEAGKKLESKLFSSVQVFGTRGTGAGQFNKPRSIGVDRQDNFYVVDMTGRVQKFSPDGKFLLHWQMPQTDKGKPKGMACDRDGNMIVVEPHYSRANHFTPEGKLVAQWGKNGTNGGQLFFPRAVAVNSHGEIYLSEYGMVERIQHFSHLGTNFVASIGSPGTERGCLNRAEGIGIGPDDLLFEADSCNHRVQVFSPEGKLVTTFGSAGSGANEMSYPYDVRVDSLGYRFVCEFGNSRVQVFDAGNRSFEIIGGPGAEPGQMNNPWAIALDSRGNLLVADSLNHRVQKFIRREPLGPAAKNPPSAK